MVGSGVKPFGDHTVFFCSDEVYIFYFQGAGTKPVEFG
jgi:hypothetical protein